VVVLAVVASFSATANAGSEETIRKLLPAPKECSLQDSEVPIVADGKLNLVVLAPQDADPKETLAADWIAREIKTLSGLTPEITADRPRSAGKGSPVALVLATCTRPTENLKQVQALLDDADRKLLADPARSEQAYVLCSEGKRIVIVGGSAQGTLYGAMTFLQLLQGDRARLSVPQVHIRDWPDFRYRVAENWTYTEGRMHWGRGWCYDWGEGQEAYRKRAESIFDRCLRYKINMICFSAGFGESFSQMWNPDEFPVQKELNRLADERGIKLMIGGYGIATDDEQLLNRKSYPDGEPYLCLTTQNMGNCRSNEALTRKIQEQFREYVRKTEPRALYIHHEDSDTYASAEWLWKHRCEQCRRRWPNEEMAAADGAAGAFTEGYNALCDAIFSVKNAGTGYDAARDCLVVLVAPTYTAAQESDAVWDKQLAYWKTVSGLLKHRKNVCIGIREQFLRGDNHQRRILEMSNAIRQEGDGPGMFLFFVSNASLYCMGPLFVPVPAAMSKLNEGAEVAYYMCGKIFQEPQILMNAAHMWNTDSLAACATPESASECLELYRRYAERKADPPGVFGEGGFLELACQRLYGNEAGKPMERLHAMKTQPICFARELYIWGRAGLYYDWTPELQATQEAFGYVESALAAPGMNPENRPTVERLRKCLAAGERFIQLRLEYQHLVPLATAESATVEAIEDQAQGIQKQMDSMEQYLADNFSFDWATPRGGDVGIWKSHLGQMRRELSDNVSMWTGVVLARDCARREAAGGKRSLVANGDMEEDGGWTFHAVTGEEETAYVDGGYVSDRAAVDRRSYQIKHGLPETVSQKWPMPLRTTWGEIEQRLQVNPGQKYVVVFRVFNNYGGASGILEYQVYVGDKLMWACDASSPKGWRSGGFFFEAASDTVLLRLRTTDVHPTVGWQGGQGDSWWDAVEVYPVSDP
jgi:hypothetical protein